MMVDSESKDEDSSQQGVKKAGGRGWVIPSFQAIADEIKRAKAGEDKKKICRGLLSLSEDELRSELFKVLRQFFVFAFTIIVKAKKLSPSEAFGETQAFGISVPIFLHPSSLEYVKEFSRKMVMFLNRSTCEGAVIHVNIEKNKTLHVVQRFIFRTNGSLEVLSNVDDDEEDEEFDLDELKSRCRNSLLRLMNAEMIKPMIATQYSRWSISIGLKKEFVDVEDIDELWRTDPNGSYFPWKKRPRNLASIQMDESLIASTSSDRVVSNENNDTASLATASHPTTSTSGDTSILTSEPVEIIPTAGDFKATDEDGTTQRQMTESNQPATISTDNPNISNNDYAAPAASTFHSSIFSPKLSRSPTSGSHRMSQIRQRLLKAYIKP